MKSSYDLEITRRSFLKHSFSGATLLGISPVLAFPGSAQGIAGGTCPHPEVSGLRVVGAHDPAMTRDVDPVCPWSRQDELVVDRVVSENMDKMALALTGETSSHRAWQRIFIKPPGKSWGEVVVAIKTNNIGRQHTRSAVMRGICQVLLEHRGVAGSNIFIYDGKHGRDLSEKTPFRDIPEGCRIVNRWDGINTEVSVPAPWKGGVQKAECLKNIASRQVHILVNLSVCKGHSNKFGGFTMTMKNHLGTFDPKWAHRTGSTDYLLSINKTPEILGELEPETGKVLFPRQQLCLIDALWASQDGPHCQSSTQPNRLFMGTFSPVLDYVVASRFRKQTMGWDMDEGVSARFLTDFGLSRADLQNEGQIINAA
jgi:hypothetical protein